MTVHLHIALLGFVRETAIIWNHHHLASMKRRCSKAFRSNHNAGRMQN